ncbi:hypothetical protein IWW38_002115 [Coemansia aciculifera]|uniref:Uncharacterized protein n=1 Tax=Coemansia aciculifera TaxID=417176 RepID=A0ACC1M4F6_9FUNG|nr:hypothetical protein IWW38_002115 [Coemansia aciculifera]
MAANSAAQQMHHHHHHSSSSVGNGSGLGISYLASSARLPGVPSSPQSLVALAGGSSTSLSSVTTGGPVSPTASYMDSKNARYAPYGTGTTGFQPSGMTASGPKQALGSKRGSIDHHYHQLHTSSAAAAAVAVAASSAQQHSSLTSVLTKNHHHDPLMVASSAADQDNGLTMAQNGSSSQQQQHQQSSMNSSYFEGLLAKSEQ